MAVKGMDDHGRAATPGKQGRCPAKRPGLGRMRVQDLRLPLADLPDEEDERGQIGEADAPF